MKKSTIWILAGIAAGVGALFLFRNQLGGVLPALGLRSTSNAGDTAPGPNAQLIKRAPTPKQSGLTPTQQQLFALFGTSSPGGTMQTVGNSIAVANQALGLFGSLRDLYPDLAGAEESADRSVDPSALYGNPTETVNVDYQTGLDSESYVQSAQGEDYSYEG